MSSTVHHKFAYFAMLSALLLLHALLFITVVRAQENTNDDSPKIETVAFETATSTMATTSPTVDVTSNNYLETIYQREGIPGDPGIVVGDFVVGPGKVDFTLNPGETKTVFVNITNRTGEKRKFNLTFEDAVGSRNTEQSLVLLGDERGPYSIKDYLSVPSKTFILEHNMRARVPVTIHIPADAEPGGMYGSVLVDTVAIKAKPGDTAGTEPQSAIIARIGTLFFVTVPGEVAHNGLVKDFSTIPRNMFFQEGPINFGILFENNGSIHLAPYGEMRITNIFGEEVGYVEIDPWFALPDSLRLREIAWQREMLFGKYTATVYINRSYDDVVDEVSYSFWVLPWKIIGATFSILFVIFFVIRAFFKKFEFKRK